eukprot:576920-Pelagomonas_calceolata.AAC.1
MYASTPLEGPPPSYLLDPAYGGLKQDMVSGGLAVVECPVVFANTRAPVPNTHSGSPQQRCLRPVPGDGGFDSAGGMEGNRVSRRNRIRMRGMECQPSWIGRRNSLFPLLCFGSQERGMALPPFVGTTSETCFTPAELAHYSTDEFRMFAFKVRAFQELGVSGGGSANRCHVSPSLKSLLQKPTGLS